MRIPPKLIKIDLPRRDPRLTVEDIRKRLLTYLYITYSYAGPEISYPVKPFMCLSTESAESFWNRCLHLSIRSSDQVRFFLLKILIKVLAAATRDGSELFCKVLSRAETLSGMGSI
ncbi:unnamed protein product [Oikopleura dioica]|uniref:Uncharacterized protein n=1 Tax=Oikopleura dioica TaxID=34765 RepID=E4X6U2_OIKDI|nr:unnamed protein product [Oikopleura dioica]